MWGGVKQLAHDEGKGQIHWMRITHHETAPPWKESRGPEEPYGRNPDGGYEINEKIIKKIAA